MLSLQNVLFWMGLVLARQALYYVCHRICGTDWPWSRSYAYPRLQYCYYPRPKSWNLALEIRLDHDQPEQFDSSLVKCPNFVGIDWRIGFLGSFLVSFCALLVEEYFGPVVGHIAGNLMRNWTVALVRNWSPRLHIVRLLLRDSFGNRSRSHILQ